MRRGDVRTAIIDVLHRARTAEEPINGYQVIQEISELSNGEWRPSPGSVYPTIQQLQDEGLVESDDERGRRTIRLTDSGVAWAEDNTAELASVWAPFARTEQPRGDQPSGQADIKSEIGQVVSAVWQLGTQGSEQQRRPRSTSSSTPGAASTASSRTDGTASDEHARPAHADRRQRSRAGHGRPGRALRRRAPRPRGVRRAARRDLDRADPRRPGRCSSATCPARR